MRYVYFMQTTAPRRIKIGVATKPEARRRELQSGNPDKIEIAALIEAERPFEVESFLHRRFKHLRLEGEWFKPDADLRQLIRGCARFQLGAEIRGLDTVALRARPLTESDVQPLAYALATAGAVLQGLTA